VTFTGSDQRQQQQGGRQDIIESGEIIKIKLTDPEGFVQSNDVISDVFVALDEIKQA
jgi:hypothetical protein